jgi:hypothetical protein
VTKIFYFKKHFSQKVNNLLLADKSKDTEFLTSGAKISVACPGAY